MESITSQISLLRSNLTWYRGLWQHAPKWTWTVGGKESLHYLTLSIRSLSYARVTLSGRYCLTLYHEVWKRQKPISCSSWQLAIMDSSLCPYMLIYILTFGIIGWNLIKLTYQVFIQKFRQNSLENFDYQTGISPLLFSQFCMIHHNTAGEIQSDSITISAIGQQQQYRKAQKFSINQDGLLGKVWICNTASPYVCLVIVPWLSWAGCARIPKYPVTCLALWVQLL